VVVGNHAGLRDGKSRVLVDGKPVVATAGLGAVTLARSGTVGIVGLVAVDGLAAETYATVFQAGEAEAVALAVASALLDRHGIGGELAAEAERVMADRLLVAAGVDEGLEIGCARRELRNPGLDLDNQGGGCQKGSSGSEGSHSEREVENKNECLVCKETSIIGKGIYFL
jgi:hypothetical protein